MVFDEPAGPALFSSVHEAISQNIGTFTKERGPGVVLLVYSVMLTRGIQNIESDKDMAENTLINEHGYASQELLNCMLTGLAVSNPHDGDIDVDEGFMVKGIKKQGEVGYLTFFEHFDQLKVG
jgi:hypothetical protein